MGAHVHIGCSGRDLQAALTAGKRLFINMGMEQQPGKGIGGIVFRHCAIWQYDIPAIGIIFPTCVWVADSDIEYPALIFGLDRLHKENISIGSAAAWCC